MRKLNSTGRIAVSEAFLLMRWWHWLFILAAFTPLYVVLISKAHDWQAATDFGFFKSVLWSVFFAAVAIMVIATALLGAKGHANDVTGPNAKQWTARFAVVGLALMGIASNMAVSIATTRVDSFLKDADPTVEEFYQNYDTTKLAGRVVRMMILKEHDATDDQQSQITLIAIANHAPMAWVGLATKSPGESDEQVAADRALIAGAHDEDLAAYLFDRDRDGLDNERWATLIRRWIAETSSKPLESAVRARLVQRLRTTFAVSIREGAKLAYEKGDKAWAALQIDMANHLMFAVKRDMPLKDENWQREMAALHDDAASIRVLISNLDAKARLRHAETIAFANDILEELRKINVQLYRTKVKLDGIEDKVDILLAWTVPQSTPDGIAPPPPNAELTEAIRAMIATGNPLEKAAAEVAKGVLNYGKTRWRSADIAIAQCKVWQASRVDWRDDQSYQFNLVLGDRRAYDDDPDGGLEFYRQALRLRPNGRQVRHRYASALADCHQCVFREALHEARQIFEKLSGDFDADPRIRSGILNDLAMLLDELGDLKGARWRMELAIEIDEENYPSDHAVFAIRYSNLAFILHDLGDVSGAISLLDRAIEIDKKTYDANHPSLAIRYAKRAMLLNEVGDWPGAQLQMARAIEIWENAFVSNHPTLAKAYGNYAMILRDMGDLSGARGRIEHVIGMLENTYDLNHPVLASGHSNLAMILRDMGDLAGARLHQEGAIKILEKAYDANHPALAVGYSNMALILQGLGDLTAARILIERAIAIQENVFLPDHPALAVSYSNLAMILVDLGEPSNARSLLERAIAIQEEAFDADRPAMAITYSNLALTLHQLGNWPEGRKRDERAIEIMEGLSNAGHATLGTIYANLAMILLDMGNLSEARSHMEHAIEINSKVLDENHPTRARDYSNYAMILHALGKFSAARSTMERAIAIDQKAFDANHPILAVRYSNLAAILIDLGDLQAARMHMNRAIKIDEKTYDTDHVALARSYGNLAVILKKLGDLSGARSRMNRAIEIEEKAYDADHPSLATSYHNMAGIEAAENNLMAALEWETKANGILRRHFEDNHPRVKISDRSLAGLKAMIAAQSGDTPPPADDD